MSHEVTEFMNMLFPEGHQAWKGEKLLTSVLFFFPTFSQLEGNRPSRSFRALEGWKLASPSFSRRPLWPWKCAGHLRSLSPTNSELRVSWHRRRVESEAEKQIWRGRRYDQSQLNTMFTDGASVRKASATTATGQTILGSSRFTIPQCRIVFSSV